MEYLKKFNQIKFNQMKSNYNLYDDSIGCKTFSGVIQSENKGLVMMYDQWNADDFNTDIPEGINMLLIRTMESFLGIEKTNTNAHYIK
jgi:hypothetical protein